MRSLSVSRVVASGALALTAVFGIAACSAEASVSKSQVSAKLKTESDTKGMSTKVVDCLADTLLKHGNKSDLKKYVDGKKKLNDIRQASGTDKGIQAELEKCVK
ncbi:MAG: hypothetical protein M3042_10175 [Actinomycetota bacterium]|nr:hypothetical protein [Actinomycetota bacterium]